MSRATVVVILVALMGLLLGTAASASQVTLLYDQLQIIVQSSAGVLPLEHGVGVCDEITIKLECQDSPGSTTILYLDNRPALFANSRQAILNLDTTGLAEGEHELRVESGLGGEKLASASLLLNVANGPSALHRQIAATASQPAPVFQRLYRKRIPREVVWFNGREGDLEKHGFKKYGEIYITATDLFRHVGGTIIWGPTQNWIELHRNNVVIRVIPGSKRIYVNGQEQELATPALRRANRTFVPVAEICSVLGLHTGWNAEEQRLYVTFRP